MRRIVLTTAQMDQALGLPPETEVAIASADDTCPAPTCVVRGPHGEHRTDRGVRWMTPDQLREDSDA